MKNTQENLQQKTGQSTGVGIVRFVLLFLFAMIFLLIGCSVAAYGFAYYVSIEPKADHWLQFITSMDPSRRWLFTLFILISGLFTATLPLSYILLKAGQLLKKK